MDAASDTNAREIVIERVFDAPRELVWEAWTNPEHVAHWWGPKGFGGAACELDLRVGGAFRLDLCASDGSVYPCVGTFREIVKHERIVYEGEATEGHPCGAGIPPRATVTVNFAERSGKTQLTLTRDSNPPKAGKPRRTPASSSAGKRRWSVWRRPCRHNCKLGVPD